MNLVLGISHERDRTNLRMLGHQFLVCHPLTKVDSKQHWCPHRTTARK